MVEINFWSPPPTRFHRNHNCLKCLDDPPHRWSYITSDCLIIRTPFQPCRVRRVSMHIYQDRDKNSSPPFTLWVLGNIKSTPGICSIIRDESDRISKRKKKKMFSIHISVCSFIMFWSLIFNVTSRQSTKRVKFSFSCCPTVPQMSGNGWLCSVARHMKGSQVPAFIASHFGKILPVLGVNSNMPFLWKILCSAAHNMTDCCFLWTPYSNSFHIKLFPVRMWRECNYNSPIIPFFSPSSPLKLPRSHHALCFMGGFRCRRGHGVEEIAFSVRYVCKQLCLRAASVHLRGLITPPVWLLSSTEMFGARR